MGEGSSGKVLYERGERNNQEEKLLQFKAMLLHFSETSASQEWGWGGTSKPVTKKYSHQPTGSPPQEVTAAANSPGMVALAVEEI